MKIPTPTPCKRRPRFCSGQMLVFFFLFSFAHLRYVVEHIFLPERRPLSPEKFLGSQLSFYVGFVFYKISRKIATPSHDL